MAKKVYFIGIAGKTMAPLAKAFKDMGWEVSGSDQEKVYPPISTYLEENRISYKRGYRAENVPKDADLVVAGYSALLIDSENPEYKKAQDLKLKIKSFPEVLQEYLIKENSIVVAGTYGKTTLSALIAWILTKAGLNPSYMTGGIPVNLGDGVRITDSLFSVVEGDEVPALRKTDPPKFMFFRPKYLLLTATKHDHPEIYKTPEDYLEAFVKLVGLLPANGILIYNQESVDEKVVNNFAGKKVPYSSVNQPWVKTNLLGRHNQENISGAIKLCRELGIKEEVIKDAVESFGGVKTRLEFLGKPGGRFIYWDFSQHPEKVKAALNALRENYPQNQIVCIFDPAMTGLKYQESLDWYPKAFDQADQVIVGKVGFLKEIPKGQRVTGRDIVEAIAQTQPQVFYEPIDEKIKKWLGENTHAGDVIVFMSSGGLRFMNLIDEVIKKLKS